MSTVFGVPPPPRPSVVENPRPAEQAPKQPAPRIVSRDGQPWRRRLVLLLALLAVAALVVGNVATWLHVRGLDAERSAGPAASASIEQARAEAYAVAQPALLAQVEAYYAASRTPLPANTVSAVDSSVDAALNSPEFSELWESSVRRALEIEIAAIDGTNAAADAGDDVITVDLSAVAPVTNASMNAAGFTFLAGASSNLGAYTVPFGSTERLPQGLLHALDTWWALFLLLAVALGAAAIVLARRRLRLGVVLGLDAALGFALTLIAVWVSRSVVRDSAEFRYRELAEDAYGGVTASLVTQTAVLLVLALVAAAVCAVLAKRGAGSPAA